jgi:hypothetical protein
VVARFAGNPIPDMGIGLPVTQATARPWPSRRWPGELLGSVGSHAIHHATRAAQWLAEPPVAQRATGQCESRRGSRGGSRRGSGSGLGGASRGGSGGGLGGGSRGQLGNPVARGVSQGDRRQCTLLWQVARLEVDSKVVVWCPGP